MPDRVARQQLVIFASGEEVTGAIFYGLFHPGGHGAAQFPGVWGMERPTNRFLLEGDGWEVLMWEVAIDPWPPQSEWSSSVQVTLSALTRAGARVAWLGGEGFVFSDPPTLFDPVHMTRAVLTWLTDDGATGGEVDLDEPVRPVDDDVLRRLRAYSHGLSDVT